MSRTKIYKVLLGLMLFLAPFAFILPEITHAQPPAAPGDILFFDDFNGTSIDTSKWFPGLHQWGSNNRGVVPQNLSVHSYNDNGNTINVLDTEAHGDQYTGPVMGILSTNPSFPIGDPQRYTTQTTGTRVGGLVWTQARWGGGRYEVRMKNLPLSGGCSCIWNYYEPAAGDYTEIDIEMPANGHANDANWFNWAGLNTYFPSPADADAVYQNVNLGFAQNDGNFHIYRWDWYDGINGPKKIEWYVDGVLKATATNHVPGSPAQLWVGNWPAIWSGNFQYTTQHLYIDWVKITELGSGPTSTPTRTNTPGGPTNTPTFTPTRTNTPIGPTNTPTNTPPSGSNLLTNPGFETGTSSGWTCSGTTAVETANPLSGTYNLRLTPNSTTTARCQQTVTVVPGNLYTLSVMIKTTNGIWGYIGVDTFSEVGSTAATYTQKSMTFTPTTTSVTVYASAWMQQTGNVYIDDMSLVGPGGPTPTPTNTSVAPTNTPTNTAIGPTNTPTRTNTPVAPTNTPTNTPSGNLVVNPGFETGTTSGWTCFGTTAVETANPFSGTHNLRLTPDSLNTARCEQTITVTPGHLYTLSGMLKTTNGIWEYIGVNGFGEVGTTSATYIQKTMTFTPTTSTVIIYASAWKQQTGNAYADDIAVN